jgi:flagellar motor protein MotB
MMFARWQPTADDEDKNDVFAPVADLMVGVVFIFIILMVALVLNLRNEDTVAKSEYDQKVAQVHAQESEIRDLKSRLEQESLRRSDAEARAEMLAVANSRLTDFVGFVRDSNAVRLMSQLASADQTRSRLLEKIRSRLLTAGIDVTVNSALGTLMLPARKLFDVGRADPTSEGRKAILQVGAVLADVLPCYADTVAQGGSGCGSVSEASQLNAVYIEGHTDVRPFGAGGVRFTDNWDLSAGRAIEAFKLVASQYEALRTLRNKDGDALLGVSGYADTRPALRDAPDRTLPEIADKDRRIEIRVIMTTNEDLVISVLSELNTRLKQLDDIIPH